MLSVYRPSNIMFYLFTTLFLLKPILSSATSLDDLPMHLPDSPQWSEQWFYNIHDPQVGYFKVSLQAYLENGDNKKLKAYVHVAISPNEGKTITYDFYDDDLLVSTIEQKEFYFEVPGLVYATENKLELTTDEFFLEFKFDRDHERYWQVGNVGRGVYWPISNLPGVSANWFLWTVKTDTEYVFSKNGLTRKGTAYTQLDKGWYDELYSEGAIYVMGVSAQDRFMFSGGSTGDDGIELWAGRYLSDTQNLTFLPAFANFTMKRVYDPCKGELDITMHKLGKKLRLQAKADPDSFYSSTFPSVDLFGASYGYMKSMQAKITITIDDIAKETVTRRVPQGLLEFSGNLACKQFFSNREK